MQTDAPGTTYVVVQITNKSNIANTDLHVFVQSKTQVYQITNGIASVVATPSGDAPSSSIHDLKQPDGTYSFKINQADDLNSGRIYFSDSKSAVQGLNGPSATSGDIFDFVELTITGNHSINLDTSQIDQFGIPITVQVNPKDSNFPNGTGIVAGLSRKSVITNFDTLTSEAAFAAYKDCKTSIPQKGTIPAAHRLIGPQHVIDGLVSPTSLAGNITGASHNSGADTTTTYTATFTLTTSGQTFGSVTGYVAAGPGVPPGATVKTVVNTTTVTLESKKGKFLDMAGATLSFYSASSNALVTAMDEAIYRMFAHYKEHTLYLVANGHVAGMEIFEGKVITNFKLPQGLTDINGKTDTEYTVFQFTGMGYTYDGAKNTLTALPAVPAGQTNVYQVFYPYFSTNCAESPHSNALTAGGPPPPPEWFNAGWNTVLGNINIASPATLMALACADNFADSAYQEQAYQQTSAVLQDSTVLGNIENQLVTMLNRGITPNTGSGSNLHVRLGYVKSSGIGPIDPLKLEPYLTLSAIPPLKPNGAITKYDLMELIAESIVLDPANPQRVGIVASSIEATFFLNNAPVTTYNAATGELNTTGSPTNQVSSVDFDPTTGQLTANWANAIDIDHTKATFAFGYGPYLSDHYATVELLDPNDPAQPITFTNDVGTDNTNLVAGMKMTTTSQFSQPMSLYYSGDDGSKTVVIQSPIPLQPFNAGLLNFGRFYPMQEETPEGSWNAYAYYFHNGVNGQDVPTIDGRGYAFPFDDNGGYSSDLDVDFQSGEAVTVSLTLNEVVDPAS